MEAIKVRWKVAEYLERHGKTPYALWKASGLNQGTAYQVATGKSEALRLETLEAIVLGLEKLTGERVELNDLLEIVRA